MNDVRPRSSGSSAFNDVLNLKARFPSWPFCYSRSHLAAFEYELLFSEEMGMALSKMGEENSDHVITVAVLEDKRRSHQSPEPDIYASFAISRVSGALPDWFAGPAEWDPAIALSDYANIVAIIGLSREWAILADRSWELGIIASKMPLPGPVWAELDLRDVRTKIGQVMVPVDRRRAGLNAEVSVMLANVEDHDIGARDSLR